MAINFKNALGVHEQALQLRVQRAEVLANNLANADTPGFKARDVDFRSALANAQAQSQPSGMKRTHERHMDDWSGQDRAALMYRVPHQPAIDGNTVDSQQEQTRFMRNAMDYQASFEFLNSRFKGLTSALRGE